MENEFQTNESVRSIEELKNAALVNLNGRWGNAVLFTFVSMLLIWVWVIAYLICANMYVSQQSGIGLFLLVFYGGLLLYISVIYYGIMNSYVVAERTDDSLKLVDLFMGFSNIKVYLKVAWLNILVGIFIFLWAMLLVIPGIIKIFSYAMFPYIRRDFPELSANQVIDLSKEMMDGYKWKYFVLLLSFIGWGILAVITCYIGFLWLSPYINATSAQFYEDVKRDYISRCGAILTDNEI